MHGSACFVMSRFRPGQNRPCPGRPSLSRDGFPRIDGGAAGVLYWGQIQFTEGNHHGSYPAFSEICVLRHHLQRDVGHRPHHRPPEGPGPVSGPGAGGAGPGGGPHGRQRLCVCPAARHPRVPGSGPGPHRPHGHLPCRQRGGHPSGDRHLSGRGPAPEEGRKPESEGLPLPGAVHRSGADRHRRHHPAGSRRQGRRGGDRHRLRIPAGPSGGSAPGHRRVLHPRRGGGQGRRSL